ncbi:MAG TPA: thioredoxin domain-containing protein [Arachnia sp.]|nr:thioredoxin domain-containing protein [Arachnia sp.]HMT87878.1 thioredoxin domain-containing protein [Arachnia sp.]
MANNSSLSRRAALKQQQEQEERAARTRRILGFGLGAVALAVVVILVVVIVQTMGKRQEVAAEQQTPPNATEGYGILAQAKPPVDGTPHVVIYQDFQCSGCAAYEQVFGPIVTNLVENGEITAEFRSAHFMDRNIGNDSSERAALAAAAADAVGHYDAYHNAIFAAYNGGAGYTEEQLRVEFPATAGITGDNLTRFQELYDGRVFQDFVNGVESSMAADGVTGTPTYIVDGTHLAFFDEDTEAALIDPTEESFMKAVNEAYQG